MRRIITFCLTALMAMPMLAQMGRRFPSERKVIKDPKTGVELVFLTSKSGTGDSKIYQTHNQWTSDGKWVVFRSDRVKGEAMAVNEETGTIVQITEGGFSGMLCVARKSMNLYHMREAKDKKGNRTGMEVVEVNLERLFADSEAGKLKKKTAYERICGTIPIEMCSEGDMALDGSEEFVYFRLDKEFARKYPIAEQIAPNFGPRNMGAGPGGYEMAAEAAHHGKQVVIVERDLLGGTCLNRGCIPTKALCRNAEVINTVREAGQFGVTTGEVSVDYSVAFARKEEVVKQLRDGVAMLMGGDGITVVNGEAKFVDAKTIEVAGEQYTAPAIVIATGSIPRGLPIEGAELAMTSDDILAMQELPKSLCIVGGGVIGMEFAGVFSSFGVEVTVVEFMKEILPPFDKDIAKRLKTVMSKRGVNILTQAAVNGIHKTSDDMLEITFDHKGKAKNIVAEKVLMSVGRQAVLPAGLEAAGVETSRRGIEVDDNMMTNVPGIYAIGDVNGRCMLAHAASAQGSVALAHIMGEKSNVKLNIVPSAVFTTPELAMVGLTEQQCEDQGIEVVTAKSFFRSNGKAVAMGETDGMVKLIVSSEDLTIVGCHICGPHAADLIQEAVTAMNAGMTVKRMASAIHGHPTLSEVVMAAARQF